MVSLTVVSIRPAMRSSHCCATVAVRLVCCFIADAIASSYPCSHQRRLSGMSTRKALSNEYPSTGCTRLSAERMTKLWSVVKTYKLAKPISAETSVSCAVLAPLASRKVVAARRAVSRLTGWACIRVVKPKSNEAISKVLFILFIRMILFFILLHNSYAILFAKIKQI